MRVGRMMAVGMVGSVLWAGLSFAAAVVEGPATRPGTGPVTREVERGSVELCFVLDTTGSMEGLIEGAKQKVWSIANTIIAAKDKPQIKIALVGYRDKGDAYVTKTFDLTDDIDTVFKNLQNFKADGGGDTPESVNQALSEAVTKLSWSADRKVAKIIFLVGDAPPHMDYREDVKYADTCQAAVKKDLIINTVQCGDMADTTPVWKEIARLGEGAYVSLAQSGNMVAIATPVDKELGDLSAAVNDTVVAYGSVAQQKVVGDKLELSAAAPAAAAADRAAFNASSGKAVQGEGDLVKDSDADGAILATIKADQLPEAMRGMTPDERKTYLEQKRKERAVLQERIAELTKKRAAYIAAEKEQLAKDHPADSFDDKVGKIVTEQYEAKR